MADLEGFRVRLPNLRPTAWQERYEERIISVKKSGRGIALADDSSGPDSLPVPRKLMQGNDQSFPPEEDVTSCPGSLTASAASAAPAAGVFAAIAASVAGAFAPLAVFFLERLSASPVAGVPSPAAAGACRVPDSAWLPVSLAVAGTSGRPSDCQYAERWAVPPVEGRGDGRNFPPSPYFRRGPQECRNLQLLLLRQRRAR